MAIDWNGMHTQTNLRFGILLSVNIGGYCCDLTRLKKKKILAKLTNRFHLIVTNLNEDFLKGEKTIKLHKLCWWWNLLKTDKCKRKWEKLKCQTNKSVNTRCVCMCVWWILCCCSIKLRAWIKILCFPCVNKRCLFVSTKYIDSWRWNVNVVSVAAADATLNRKCVY